MHKKKKEVKRMGRYFPGRKTIEELKDEIKDAKDWMEYLKFEKEAYRAKQDVADAYLAWLDEKNTLDELLQKIMDSGLCKQLRPWKKE